MPIAQLTPARVVVAPGVDPPRGILLHGPSGCGKTLLAQAIAGELGVPFQSVSAPELVGGVSGESEEKVCNYRKHAVSLGLCNAMVHPIKRCP